MMWIVDSNVSQQMFSLGFVFITKGSQSFGKYIFNGSCHLIQCFKTHHHGLIFTIKGSQSFGNASLLKDCFKIKKIVFFN